MLQMSFETWMAQELANEREMERIELRARYDEAVDLRAEPIDFSDDEIAEFEMLFDGCITE